MRHENRCGGRLTVRGDGFDAVGSQACRVFAHHYIEVLQPRRRMPQWWKLDKYDVLPVVLLMELGFL